MHCSNMCVCQIYLERCMQLGIIPLPNHIPTDLLAFEKRKTVHPDEWSSAGAIWIRTWYGDEGSSRERLVEDTHPRGAADAGYGRLWRKALWPADLHGFDDAMFGPYVFDDNDAAYEVSAREADGAVEPLGGMPSFILNALMRCPDAMEGSSARNVIDDEYTAEEQALLVVVADGKACEEGWALLMGVNEKGQVLPYCVRCKAFEVGQNVASWNEGGEPLDLVGAGESEVYYRDANRSGNGWDEDEPL